MNKQFTKVTKTYSTKNRLQLAILKELELADSLLFANKQEASNFINKLYENALLSYKGNAVVPPLRKHEPNNDLLVFYVEDVVSISIYNVKTDLS
jgi:hypothetical protein